MVEVGFMLPSYVGDQVQRITVGQVARMEKDTYRIFLPCT